jgi:hypothetical protein
MKADPKPSQFDAGTWFALPLPSRLRGKERVRAYPEEQMPLDTHEIQKIAQTWIEMHRLPEDSQERETKFWAFERLSDLVQEDPEEAWRVIEAMRRRLDGTDAILANIAAGPLENLLVYHGEKFIDRFETLARDDQQFRKLLGAVWQNDMSDAFWARIKAIAAPPW